MKNIKEKVNLYFSSIVTVIISIPFFLNPSIGADWDSYALIGTYKNFMESGLYTPSRPPGFPLYELLIGLCVKISEFLFLSMEQTILFTQMILLLSLNFLIYKFFNKKKDSNYFIYLIAVFSPVFLLSGLTAIDYVLGSLLGFLSLYISMYSNNKQKEILVSFTLAMSIATRLSNIIFLIVVLILMRKELKKGFQIFVLSTFLFASFYLIFYLNLYSFYLENKIYNSWFDLMCIFNLTNTDHDFYNRIGRFTLKQIPYLGTVGMLIFIGSIRKLKINFKGNNLYFFLVFLFFQLSFLRLPTEEGHLLPAFIAFAIFVSQNNNKIFITIFLFVLTSNFINLKFFEVDSIDSASDINFTFSVEEGYLIQDYYLRDEIAKDKFFHYNNSKNSLLKAWSSGCPNK